MNDLGLKYSSIEGLGGDHPSWNDRLSRSTRAAVSCQIVSAFDNGIALLFVERTRWRKIASSGSSGLSRMLRGVVNLVTPA
jgi:hypothetical protein